MCASAYEVEDTRKWFELKGLSAIRGSSPPRSPTSPSCPRGIWEIPRVRFIP